MTPLLTQNEIETELGVDAFNNVIPKSQEASVTSRFNPDKAFDSVISHAQDVDQTVADRIKQVNFRDTGGKATYTKNSFKVKPTLVDFVIDVETTAIRALTAYEFAYFKETYFVRYLGIADLGNPLEVTADGRDKFFAEFIESYPVEKREQIAILDRIVRIKVGAALNANGVYPLELYMNHLDEDVRKRLES